MTLYIDADACPVKEEALRVARRHRLPVVIVSNRGLRPSNDPLVRQVVVSDAFDAADNWIAVHAAAGDGRERSGKDYPVFERSAYTWAAMNPSLAVGLAVLAGLALGRSGRKGRRS